MLTMLYTGYAPEQGRHSAVFINAGAQVFTTSMICAVLPGILMFPSTLDLFVHKHAHDLLEAISGQHGLLPPLEIGIVSYVPACALHDEVDLRVPHHES